VLCLDRTDSAGTATPTKREYISYTGITTSTLTGCTRGVAGSTAQSHNSGIIVEETFTTTHWLDLLTAVQNVLTSAGALDVTKVVDLTSSQSLSNKTLTSPTISGTIAGSPTFSGKPIITASQPVLTSDTDGTTITFNMNTSGVHTVTLGGNRILAVSNVSSPQFFVIILKQDGTGSRTVTWWSNILWAGASAPTLTTTINRYDIFSFFYDGTNYYGAIVGQNFG
jgi:hypothetical protein